VSDGYYRAMNKRITLDSVFKTDSPILPDVKIIDTWAYYDGPLFGVCEVSGEKLFFVDVVSDIWRHYKDGNCERLWTIYGVYDISIKEVEKITKKEVYRREWQPQIEDESDCIGIFWEYSK